MTATISYRRILVTGGSGFVGGYLMPAIRSQWPDADVILADRVGGARDRIPIDLEDANSIHAAIASARPDLVIHLAGQASVSGASSAAASTWRVNAMATLELATALAEHSPAATVLLASSAEVYGRAFLKGPADETTVPDPRGAYSQSKLAAENILATTLGPEACLLIVRPSNHVGPGQDERFVLASFAAQIAQSERDHGRSPIRVGNLDSMRDFMDVRDVVRAYVALLSSSAEPGCRATFNIASGVTRSIGSLLDELRSMARYETRVEIDPGRARPSEVPRAELDTAKLRASIDWRQTIPVETTLKAILDHARKSTLAKPPGPSYKGGTTENG